ERASVHRTNSLQGNHQSVPARSLLRTFVPNYLYHRDCRRVDGAWSTRATMKRKNFAPVKVGVVGLGRFGRLHALTLARLAEADLVALVARRRANLDSLAPEFPGVPGWTDLGEALAESGAEAWVVACTTAAHVPVARRILEAGKAVLLEKPVADSLEGARSLAPLVRPDSGNLMVGHIVLFNSEFQQLRAEVQ